MSTSPPHDDPYPETDPSAAAQTEPTLPQPGPLLDGTHDGPDGTDAVTRENTQGLLAMILGIAALPLMCCGIGVPLGGAAAVLGYRALQRANAGVATNRNQALAGLICGAVAVVVGILYLFLVITIGRYNFS